MDNIILISGGGGNLATKLSQCTTDYTLVPLSKERLDICNISRVRAWLDALQPKYFIHTAALTRPMKLHTDNPALSINTNIIGTANIVQECMKRDIKLIYISTDYVYPGTDGDYLETDPVLPVNEYAWSKLGGECAVRLYKNSLILRMALCEKPFPHKKALHDIKKSYIYIDDAVEIILKLKDEFGIINVGGKPMTPYEFIKQENKNIEKVSLTEVSDVNMAKDSTMNINKLKNLL